MADTEVKPAEPVAKAGDKKAPPVVPEGKKGGFYNKNKKWIYGGMAVVLILLFFFLRKSSSVNAAASQQSAATTAANGGIDPATGYLYGSPADTAALGGSGTVTATPGPQGSTGATGATGPAGPAGNGITSQVYTTGGTGQRSLSQLASALGTSTQSIINGTTSTDLNNGKFTTWLNTTYKKNPNAPIPHGLKITYAKTPS